MVMCNNTERLLSNRVLYGTHTHSHTHQGTFTIKFFFPVSSALIYIIASVLDTLSLSFHDLQLLYLLTGNIKRSKQTKAFSTLQAAHFISEQRNSFDLVINHSKRK